MRKVCEERLNAMKIIDKSDVSSKIDGVIKAEMVYVLKNYLDLILDSVEIKIDIADIGLYKLKLECLSRNIKGVKVI